MHELEKIMCIMGINSKKRMKHLKVYQLCASQPSNPSHYRKKNKFLEK